MRDVSFTSDNASFKADLNRQSAGGGGDFPGAMTGVWVAGLDFEWRPDAVKVNFLVADAPPHKAEILASWDAARVSRTRAIHIGPRAASGVNRTAGFLMRAMAQITGVRYLFLTYDSSSGNPHAEPMGD